MEQKESELRENEALSNTNSPLSNTGPTTIVKASELS